MSKDKKSVLITGGGGYIGSHLALCLEKKNWQVTILDDFSARSQQESKKYLSKNIQIIHGSILEPKVISKALHIAKPQVVVHGAALHYIPACLLAPVQTMQVNLLGTQQLINTLHRYKSRLRQFVYFSSGAVYGSSVCPHHESEQQAPGDVYGLSKYYSELYIQAYAKSFTDHHTILRLANVYGSIDPWPHFIPRTIEGFCGRRKKLFLGNIETKRDYIYINDVINFMYSVINSPKKADGCFNVSTGKATSGGKILKLLTNITGFRPNYVSTLTQMRHHDPQRLILNNHKAQVKLGWRPQITIGDGIRLTLNSYAKKLH